MRKPNQNRKPQESSIRFSRHILPESGHLVTMALSPNAAANQATAQASDIEEKDEWQKWGTSDTQPVKNRTKIEGSSTAFPLMVRMAEMMFGKGLTYYVEKRTKTGIETDWSEIPEVEEFIAGNDVNLFILERLMDFKFHNNLFCEHILSNDRSKIVNVYHLEAEFSRKGAIQQNKFTKLGYKGDWSKNEDPLKIPFVENRDFQKEIIQKKKLDKFAMHDHFPSPGRTTYAKPAHAALLEDDGWLDYANSVPKLMNAHNKIANQLQFHVEVPGDYWERTYADWNGLTHEEKEARKDEVLTEMDKWFKGKDAKSDTFLTHFAVDHAGKYLSGWKITVLDAKAKKDIFLTSLQEADIQISRGIGMDVSLAGIQPAGGKMGAGSGSDKRTAFTNAVSVAPAAMEIILAPFYRVAKYNGWPAGLKFAVQYDVPTTLNNDPSGVNSITQ